MNTQSTKVVWEDLYTDLSNRAAKALREARVKPDQLKLMSDGEITAIDGIGETSLEEIRAKYKSDSIIEDLKVEEQTDDSDPKKTTEAEEATTPRRPRHPNRGGKKIKAMKSKVDRTNLYPAEEAIKLVKETNITSFDATLVLHLNLKEKMTRVEISFPHQAGKKKVVAIADDALLKKIDKGELDFDILLATPAMMPKLAKYARILGPKGLMPSPKAGTITPDPEAKQKEFQGGKTIVKGENKHPLMHITLGKLSQDNKKLLANLETALEAVKPKNITRATLSSTMSPGIKLFIERN